MYRKALTDLTSWKTRPGRKPLIVRGARQVGKTWLIREFSKQFANLIEINFDRTPEKAQLFLGKDIGKCLQLLEVDANSKIIPGQTLIFLDEIQAVPEMFPLLRYFHEERPDIHVVAAGSLLEFLLADHTFSMPVGRIEYLHLGPMDVEEFLLALGQETLVTLLNSHALADSIPESIHQRLLHFVKLFWVVGGMPAAVAALVGGQDDFEAVRREHASILQTYEDDFSKYRKRIYPQRLRKVFRRIPSLIGNKLKYVHIDPAERSRELADTVQILELARVIHRVFHSAGNGVPLGAEAKENDFKPLFMDIGLVSTSLGLNLPALELAEDLLLVNNGALAEQFVGQHLLYGKAGFERPQLYYWNREKRNASSEVDYLIPYGSTVVPVEVKAGKTGSLKSLQVFVAERQVPIAVRFSALPPSCDRLETGIAGKDRSPFLLITLPLYLVGQTWRLLSQAFSSPEVRGDEALKETLPYHS